MSLRNKLSDKISLKKLRTICKNIFRKYRYYKILLRKKHQNIEKFLQTYGLNIFVFFVMMLIFFSVFLISPIISGELFVTILKTIIELEGVLLGFTAIVASYFLTSIYLLAADNKIPLIIIARLRNEFISNLIGVFICLIISIYSSIMIMSYIDYENVNPTLHLFFIFFVVYPLIFGIGAILGMIMIKIPLSFFKIKAKKEKE